MWYPANLRKLILTLALLTQLKTVALAECVAILLVADELQGLISSRNQTLASVDDNGKLYQPPPQGRRAPESPGTTPATGSKRLIVVLLFRMIQGCLDVPTIPCHIQVWLAFTMLTIGPPQSTMDDETHITSEDCFLSMTIDRNMFEKLHLFDRQRTLLSSRRRISTKSHSFDPR